MSVDYVIPIGGAAGGAAIVDRITGTVYATRQGSYPLSGLGAFTGPALILNGDGLYIDGARCAAANDNHANVWIFLQDFPGTGTLHLTKLTIQPVGSPPYPTFSTESVDLSLVNFSRGSAQLAPGGNIIFSAGLSVYSFSPGTRVATLMFTAPSGDGTFTDGEVMRLTNISDGYVVAYTPKHLYELNASTLAEQNSWVRDDFGISTALLNFAVYNHGLHAAWVTATDFYRLDLVAKTKLDLIASRANYRLAMNTVSNSVVMALHSSTDIESVSIATNGIITGTLPDFSEGGTASVDGAGNHWLTDLNFPGFQGEVWEIDPYTLTAILTVTPLGKVSGVPLQPSAFGFVSFISQPVGHGVNCNDYPPIGESAGSTTPPGNGQLLEDLEPMRAWCRANGISVALNQDSQRTAKDLLDELFAIGNSAPVYSGDRLKVIPYDEISSAGNGAIYNAPTAAGPVANLDDRDFVSDGKTPPVSFRRKRRADCDNVVAIEHIERTLDYSRNTTSECDQKSVALFGPRKGGTLDATDLGVNVPSGSKSFLSIHSARVAQRIASILAKRGALGVNEYTFKLKAERLGLEAMDLVTLTDSRLGLSNVAVRLTSAKETSERTLECTADEFIYGLNHPSEKFTGEASGTQVQINVDPGLVNAPIIFQPTTAMLSAGSTSELAFIVSGADPNYGGCVAFISLDGGSTYSALGNVGPGTTGLLTADFPSHADPDTTDTLAVDLSESGGSLSTVAQAIADAFGNQCYLYGGTDYNWEIVCPTIANLTSAEHYSMITYIRRAVLGSALSLHPNGNRFASLTNVFMIDLPSSWIGLTLRFKFAAYNKLRAQQNDLSVCTVYTYTPVAATGTSGTVASPGGFYVNGTGVATGSTGGSGGGSVPGTITSVAALTGPNGSMFADYDATSANASVRTNFSTSISKSDKSINIQSGFVSRESIHNLLYTGHTTKVFACPLDWWGGPGGHISNGYNSNDTTQQTKQIAELKARGFDGSFPTWYGSGVDMNGRTHLSFDYVNQSMLKQLAAIEAAGGFQMFTMLEHAAFDPATTGQSGINPTQQIKDYLDYANSHYFGSSAYLKIGGRPVFGFFGEGLVAGVNWTSIDSYAAGLSNGHPYWIFRNNAGFSTGSPNISKGSFGWPEPGDATYLTDFYTAALAHPTFSIFAPAYKGFNDTLASWGSGRSIAQSNGQTFLDCFAAINANYNSGSQLPFVILPTYGDYEEGTQVETGITDNIVMTPSIASNTISWTITGNENCVVRYEIYAAPHGNVTSLTLLGSVNVGSPRSFAISLPTGSYDIYVYAVGVSCVQNVLSAATSYTV